MKWDKMIILRWAGKETRKKNDCSVLVGVHKDTYCKQIGKKISEAKGEVIPSKPTVPAICRNQTGGLTDNPPIYLAHSRRPVEGAAKMETQ